MRARTLSATQSRDRGRKRIVVWSPNFAPEIMGIPPLVTEAAEWLAKEGHDVRVVTAIPNYPTRIVPAEYRGRAWFHESHGSIEVHRSWLRVRQDEGFIDKALYEVTFAAASFPLVVRQLGGADVLVCVVPSLLAAAAAAAWLRLRRFVRRPVRFVLWIQDIVLAAAYAVRDFGDHARTALGLVAVGERATLRSAERIVICSPGFRRYIHASGARAENVQVVPNWVNVDRYVVDLGQPAGGPVRFLYAGNLGYTQGFETLVEAARLVGDSVAVKIVGAGNASAHVAELVRGVPNVELQPPVPEEGVPNLLANAEVQLLIQRGLSADANFPSKIGPYLSSGRPILASIGANAAATTFLVDSKGAVVVPPDDVRALASGMRLLRDDASLRRTLGMNGRAFARDRLSAGVCLPALEEAFVA